MGQSKHFLLYKQKKIIIKVKVVIWSLPLIWPPQSTNEHDLFIHYPKEF